MVLASFAENRDAKLLRPAFTTRGAGAEDTGDLGFGGPGRERKACAHGATLAKYEGALPAMLPMPKSVAKHACR